MSRQFYTFITIAMFLAVLTSCQKEPRISAIVEKEPSIFPDYSGVVIPYNISPLNFHIDNPGQKYYVRIYSEAGRPIIIKTSNPSIRISSRQWRKFLLQNRGSDYHISIYIQNNGLWHEYSRITNTISEDRLDSHLAYRHINNGYVLWREMGIYQRDLERFKETPILENTSVDYACMNCHSFANNNPDKMTLHIRRSHGGTVLVDGDNIRKLETSTDFTMSAAVYPDWHPEGTHVAFSTNLINQRFTSEEGRMRQVMDAASDIIIYDLARNMVTTSPLVSSNLRENLPAWSAKGDEIFFISAPEAVDDSVRVYSKYSLHRIPYCTRTNLWGVPETLIDAEKVNLSISFPKPSPDGRFLLFSGAAHGYFHIYYHDSNLYLMDLETMQWRKLDISSDKADSYHSWSKNGRWFVFASKRIDGTYSRPFFAHVDTDGNVSKPFVLPQRDPLFYRTFLLNYNVPQLVDGRVRFSPRKLRDVVRGSAENVKFDPSVDVDALSGSTYITTSIHD